MASTEMIGLETEIRSFEGECRSLANLPKGAASDALRLVVPRMLLALYTLRNKRSGGHTASEVSPNLMDASVAEGVADWIVAELFRLGNSLPPDEATAAVNALIERRIPLVYKDGEYRCVMKTDLAPRDELLVLLYAEPSGATVSQLAEWARIPVTTTRRYLNALDRGRLIRMDAKARPTRVTLLPLGERAVEAADWFSPRA